MAMKMIPTSEATLEQLRNFALISGLENVEKKSKRDIVETLTIAGYPADKIFVDDSPPVDLRVSNSLARPSGFDPDNERWVVIRIAPDSEADNKYTPVFMAVNEDNIYGKRGVKIAVRERFYEVLCNTIETRKTQDTGGDNAPTSFGDAEVTHIERYPVQFYGYAGLVRDGQPDVPEDVTVQG